MAEISLSIADYGRPEHVEAIAVLMQGYSADVMGGGEALPEQHCLQIAGALHQFGHALTVLAFDSENKAVGLITAFKSFSTFKNQPVLNLHDVFVVPEFRGQGVARALLELIEGQAIAWDCCKMTLEVLENNRPAQRLYGRVGFKPYQLLESAGVAQFWEKVIS